MDPHVIQNIRRLAEDLDIAESYPRYMNISYAEANDYAIKHLSKKLKGCPMAVVLVSVDYDQGLLNCLRGIKEQRLGLGVHITSINVPKTLDRIAIKFDRPYALLEG